MRSRLVVLLMVVVGLAAGCDVYEEFYEDGSLGFCAGVVDYPYVGNGVPQKELDGLALGEVTKGDPFLANMLALLPESCKGGLKEAACMAVFPRCKEIDPYFLNVCPGVCSGGSCQSGPFTGSTCLDAPGIAPQEFGFPVFPCRAEMCTSLVVDSSVCPVVSGKFYSSLNETLKTTTDAVIQGALGLLLQSYGCDDASIAGNATRLGECLVETYTINVLGLFDALPACAQKKSVALLELDVFPDVNQSTLVKSLIDGNLAVLQAANATLASEYADVVEAYGCNLPSGPKTVEPSFAFASEDNVCADVTRSSENQAVLPTGGCPDADGIYYVAPLPGMPPLASTLDPLGTEQAGGVCQSSPSFGNFNSSQSTCTNARDCQLETLEQLIGAFPKFAPSRCRAAYNELTCQAGQMKIQQNVLCLAPEGCDGTTTFGLPIQLPRFPSLETCQKYRDECAALIQPGSPLDVNCTQVLDIQECSYGLDGTVWNCTNPFNGLPLFPAGGEQTFIDASSIPSKLVDYLTVLSLDISGAFKTAVQLPTISKVLYKEGPLSDEDLKNLQNQFCECPEPLLVPDDVNAETIDGTCCQVACYGPMETEDTMREWYVVQLVISGLSVVLASYIVITWGLFKAKRSQYMVFWLSVTSVCTALTFFIPAIVSGGSLKNELCIDNTQQIVQGTGFTLCVVQGMCLLYFALALCCWWAVMCYDLYHKIVGAMKKGDDRRRKRYHIFCWTVPLISVVVTLALGYAGYDTGNYYCMFSAKAPRYFSWIVFYGPMSVLYLVGTFHMMWVINTLVQHTKRMNRHRAPSGVSTGGKTSGSRTREKYKKYRNPVLFVLFFSFVFVNLFAFRMSLDVQYGDYEDQAGSWVRCLLENFLAGIEDPASNPNATTTMLEPQDDIPEAGCGFTQPGGVSRVSLYLSYGLALGQSILIYIIFGMQKSNLDLWKKFLCNHGENRAELSSSGVSNTPSRTKLSSPGSFAYSKYGVMEEDSIGNNDDMAVAPSSNYEFYAPKL